MANKYQFKTRVGPAWEDDAYNALIRAIVDKNLIPSDVASLSLHQINALTSTMYERFGDGHRKYWTALMRFLQDYQHQILEDCQRKY